MNPQPPSAGVIGSAGPRSARKSLGIPDWTGLPPARRHRRSQV